MQPSSCSQDQALSFCGFNQWIGECNHPIGFISRFSSDHIYIRPHLSPVLSTTPRLKGSTRKGRPRQSFPPRPHRRAVFSEAVWSGVEQVGSARRGEARRGAASARVEFAPRSATPRHTSLKRSRTLTTGRSQGTHRQQRNVTQRNPRPAQARIWSVRPVYEVRSRPTRFGSTITELVNRLLGYANFVGSTTLDYLRRPVHNKHPEPATATLGPPATSARAAWLSSLVRAAQAVPYRQPGMVQELESSPCVPSASRQHPGQLGTLRDSISSSPSTAPDLGGRFCWPSPQRQHTPYHTEHSFELRK